VIDLYSKESKDTKNVEGTLELRSKVSKVEGSAASLEALRLRPSFDITMNRSFDRFDSFE
jgi:hypothetical protein